ncbi:uncharacterized protein LOC111054019 [Nilaparvata lugens]|uniref:uncharacterized protein LOC111054019 n=1 Tax=Nilaparvata lugens TaxID=108931 RepID=UPI00193D1A4F|nr:uncharacterized protein LOC111054019 [Nilaparvata lugens]
MAQRSNQSLISAFFGQAAKKRRTDQEERIAVDATEPATDSPSFADDTVEPHQASDDKTLENIAQCSSASATSNPDAELHHLQHDSYTTSSTESMRSDACPNSSLNDIGHYIGKTIDEHTKMKLLEQPWVPPENYSFPHSKRSVSGKSIKNFLRPSHLQAHKDWLVLSDVKQGLFCKYCPWFTNRNEGGYCKNVALKTLVTEPLRNFKKLTGSDGHLEVHCNTQYHKDAVTAGKNFLRVYHCPKMEVNNLINEERLSQSQKNRQKLLSIVKTVILLGRQNIPMRGHRDDGPLNLEMSDTVSNEGNFKALIKFRIIDAGDKVLEDHINTSSSRSTYISKSTQNNIIECCKAEITDVILSRIAKAELYSIMFDETSDISQRAQVSIVLRYVHFEKEFEIREDFITFIDAFEDMKEADEDNLGDERSNSEVEMRRH